MFDIQLYFGGRDRRSGAACTAYSRGDSRADRPRPSIGSSPYPKFVQRFSFSTTTSFILVNLIKMSNVSTELRSMDAEAPQQPQRRRMPRQPDLEASQPWSNTELLSGFPQTAHFLAADPDKSAVIFRRFDRVSIRNLLYLEGRIAALETLQDDLDREDKNEHMTDDNVAAAAASWEDFAILGSSGKERIPDIASKRWSQRRDKRIEIRERMKAERLQQSISEERLARAEYRLVGPSS